MLDLLAPLKLDETEIDGFVRDHACGLCLGPLVKQFAKGERHKYHAACPHCGVILQHNHVTKLAAVSYENGCRVARQELNQVGRKPRPEIEILKDLGF
jgi:DNA repair exonuclease SbcCD ATPase subunit